MKLEVLIEDQMKKVLDNIEEEAEAEVSGKTG